MSAPNPVTMDDVTPRDLIAMLALTGILANPQRGGDSVERTAEGAYRYADAMLAYVVRAK